MTENVEVLQAGHTWVTENCIYGLSMHTLAGAPEDVLPYYLEASTSRQKQCWTVSGGTFLSYQQAHTIPPATSSDSAHNSRYTCASSSSQPPPPSTSKSPSIDVVLPIQDTAQQVVSLLMPSLSKLIQNVVTKAINDHPSSQTHTSNKGKGKATEQPYADQVDTNLTLSDEDSHGIETGNTAGIRDERCKEIKRQSRRRYIPYP
jgi:hypothetical protein